MSSGKKHNCLSIHPDIVWSFIFGWITEIRDFSVYILFTGSELGISAVRFSMKTGIGFPTKQHVTVSTQAYTFISSPEPSGSQGELIVYPCSGVRCHRRCRRRQQCLNIFSSETAWPIKAKLYVEPPWEGGTKVYINGPGHMTKLASMPIYGKNL